MEQILAQLNDQLEGFKNQLAKLGTEREVIDEQIAQVEKSVTMTQGGINLLSTLESQGVKMVFPAKAEDGTTGEFEAVQ